MATIYKRGGKSNRNGNYYIQWFDASGKRRTLSAKTSDKATAQRIAAKLEADVALRRSGVIDESMDKRAKHAQRSLYKHIDEFTEYLADKNNTEKHVRMTRQHLRQISEITTSVRLQDVSSSVVLKGIGLKRNSGIGLSTSNSIIRSWKSFGKWLVQEQRLLENPVESLKCFNEKTDPRHVRRALTLEEQECLVSGVANHSTANHNLDGRARAMLYQVAFGTGFRVAEIRSLRKNSFNLAANPPTVTVEAAYSKNRRRTAQPIRRDLAKLLETWLRSFDAKSLPFGEIPGNATRMIRTDMAYVRRNWIRLATSPMEAAEREASDFLRYQDSNGLFADFHATRHTYITDIVASGASVKVAQELARHSTPQLTIGRYAHTNGEELQRALDGHRNASSDGGCSALHSAQQSCSETTPQSATSRDTEQPRQQTEIADNSMENKELSDSVRSDATEGKKRRRPDSNRGWRICNPLP